MTSVPSESDLIARAVAGDKNALVALLFRYHERLARRVARRLPDDLRAQLSTEDAMQEVHITAFRLIREFEPRHEHAFYAWLAKVADGRVRDIVKGCRRLKRGGGRARVTARGCDSSSTLMALLDRVAVDSHTPSRSVSRREAEHAVRRALEDLKDPYRQALTLRYLQGLSPAEVASRMNRTERAVHMLCNRGLRRLRESLPRS